MRRLAIAPLVVGATVAALVATLVMPSPSSEAFWSASTSGGSSAAQATAVQRVGTPTATVATQNDVTVSWPAAALGDGTAVDGYAVTRTNADTGSSVAATGGCAGTATVTTCVEADVPDGRWTYTVVARFGTSWTGPSSASSTVAIADTVAPTNALTLTATNGSAGLVGTTVYYRGVAAGAIRLTNAVADDLSGPAGSATGQITGGNRWSHEAGRVDSPSGGPYVLNPVSWTAGTGTTQTLGIDGFDAAGNNAPVTITFVNDSTAPTGGAVTYANGTVRPGASATSATVAVTFASVADVNGSGIARRAFQRSTATLTGDTCGTFGAWTEFASTSGSGSFTMGNEASVGTCVQYRHVITDFAGNVREETNANVVKVKPTYQSVVAGTSGLVDHFRFDSSSLLADSSGGGSGTTASPATTPTASADSPAVGDGGTSAFFDGSNDYVRTPRSVQDSFTIEFWFRSDAGGKGTGSNWYNGAGLVDAETPGVANDFGIALMADGRVIAGVGQAGVGDRNVVSQAGLANNVWHHVVMTRNQTNGLVELWIDGVRVGTFTSGTQSLTASANIDFGRLQTNIAGQYYRGNLDEVAIYSRVLTASEIQAHYANAL